jgi:signal transduction histidine kinase
MTIRLIALVLLAAAWIGVAMAATLLALRRIRASGHAVAEGAFAQALLDAAPMASFLLFADGRIAIGDRACAWLGLATVPERLADLAAAGFAADQLTTLATAADAALRGAGALALTIRLPGTDRYLAVQGAPFADPALPEPAFLLWIADTTAAQLAIDQLTLDRNRLDRALAAFTALIEAAPFPVWWRDATGHLAFVNPAYASAVEARDAGDAVRRGLELIERAAGPPQRRDGVETRITPAIIAGQWRMMRVVAVPLGAQGTACFAIDTQEVQDVRAELASFGAAQRAMLDRLSAGVAQFGADRTLGFHNAHFRRLFALDRESLDEHPAFDRLLDQMHAAGRVPEMRDFRAWRTERRGWFQLAEAIEESWQLPGNVHLRIVAQPLPDGGLLLICEDRTEHLALASARDTLLQVRTATLDNLFEGVGVFAADGRLHLWNSRFREMWGLEEEALVASPHLDALVQAIGPRLADPHQAGLIRELVRAATLDRQHRAGRVALRDRRHFDYAAVPLPDGNALVAIVDITAQHNVEEGLRSRNEELEETNSTRAQILARMSYQLRVPLTSIAGFAEMLADGYAGELPAAAAGYVDAILGATTNLQALIGDALDLSQGEAGSLPLAAERIDVATLVREAAQLAADRATAAGLRLLVDAPAQSGTVSGDRARLRRCLDHLVRNAIAFTPPEGKVVLRSRMQGAWVEIRITDTGAGIAEDEQARLLGDSSPLSLEHDAPLRHGRRGIGLPLARQLVAAHGGTFRLSSKVGKGTEIAIRLPVAPDG